MKTTREWAKKLIGKDSINTAARKSGLAQASLNRQIATNTIPTQSIIDLAHAYKVSAATALHDVGILTDFDLEQHEKGVALAKFSDQEIIDEVARRIARGSKDFDEEICPPDKYTLAANMPECSDGASDV